MKKTKKAVNDTAFLKKLLLKAEVLGGAYNAFKAGKISNEEKDLLESFYNWRGEPRPTKKKLNEKIVEAYNASVPKEVKNKADFVREFVRLYGRAYYAAAPETARAYQKYFRLLQKAVNKEDFKRRETARHRAQYARTKLKKLLGREPSKAEIAAEIAAIERKHSRKTAMLNLSATPAPKKNSRSEA